MAEKDSIQFPVTSFRFTLSVEKTTVGSGENQVDASFQEISGVSVEIPVEEIQEGGENRFVHRVPQPLKYPNLVLKRGLVTEKSALTDWCKKTISSGFASKVELKNITVQLLNERGENLISWTFINAYPIKWDYSTLDASKNQIFIQTIELAYQYFEEERSDWKSLIKSIL